MSWKVRMGRKNRVEKKIKHSFNGLLILLQKGWKSEDCLSSYYGKRNCDKRVISKYISSENVSYEAREREKVSCLGGYHQKGGKFLDSKSWWNITAPAGL